MALHLITSNHLEELALLLSESYSFKDDPLKAEWIIVQNKGMEKWLTMELASQRGIWGNCWYPFPNDFIQKIFSIYLKDNLLSDRYIEKDIFIWQLMNIIEAAIEEGSLKTLFTYISDENVILEKQKLFQLSSILSNLFDQYITYRPDIINSWDSTSMEDLSSGLWDDWQGQIWKKIIELNGLDHPAAVLHKVKKLIKQKGAIDSLPPFITVFGISSLPPFHQEVLLALSEVIDVKMYILNPCQQFWFDILNSSEERYIIKQKKDKTVMKDLHLNNGNSLLSSWGTYGRNFISRLYEYDHVDESQFFENKNKTLLATIQNNILNLDEENCEFNETEAVKSISFHSCYNAYRELEVLKDHILYCMEHHDLKPSEVLIMAPQIDVYVPFIETIFSHGEYPLPCNISDSKNYMRNPDIRGFLQLIQFMTGRFNQSEFITLLDCPAIAQRFHLSGQQDIIKGWIKESGIIWGKNSKHKSEENLPSFHENTWDWGFDKMLMGYALSDEGVIENNIVPLNAFEGESAILLGHLLDFYEQCKKYSEELKNQRSLKEWSHIILDMIMDFFDDSTDFDFIKEKLLLIYDYELPIIPIDVVEQWLIDLISSRVSSSGLFNGSINFCEFLPMRSIPFSFIAIIGMNHDMYPRHQSSPDFDLIASEPRPGDKSLNLEDRFIFLEALISARDFFYISYCGQDACDNSMIPPSIVVSELIDYCEKVSPQCKNLIFNEEGLHGYKNYYFSKEEGFSYNNSHFKSLIALTNQSKDFNPFISGKYSLEIKRFLTTKDFISFLTHPHRFILQKYFNVNPSVYDISSDDCEPLHIAGLEKFFIQSSMMKDFLENNQLTDSTFDFLKAQGLLPHGVIGEVEFHRVVKDTENLYQKISEFTELPLEVKRIECSIRGLDIEGDGLMVKDKTCFYMRAANFKVTDLWSMWIYLLLHGSMNQVKNGILITKDKTMKVTLPENPMKELEKLCDLYIGCGRKFPDFFPEISYEYTKDVYLKKDSINALERAKSKWEYRDFIKGISLAEDPYVFLIYKGIFPAGKNFSSLSHELFYPLISCEMKKT